MIPALFCARCAAWGQCSTALHVVAMLRGHAEERCQAARDALWDRLCEWAPLAVGALVGEAIRRSCPGGV